MKNTHKGSSQDVGKSPVFGRQALGEKMDRSHFRKSDSDVALAALKEHYWQVDEIQERKQSGKRGAGSYNLTVIVSALRPASHKDGKEIF